MVGRSRTAIKRKQIDRKVDLVIRNNKPVDLPPDWKFTIPTERFGPLTFDFNPLRENGRDDLAMHFRDALWSLRRQSGRTLKGYWKSGIMPFWRFLNCLEADGSPVTRLAQVDHRLLNLYIDWLGQQICVSGKRKGKILKSTSRRSSYYYLKGFLINCRRRVPTAVAPDFTLPANPFPHSHRSVEDPTPYSDTEHEGIVNALHSDLTLFHSGRWEEPEHQVLAMHLLSFALLSGRNLQPLLDLKRGEQSVKDSVVPGRVLLSTEKYRGPSRHVSSYEKSIQHEDFDSLVPADFEAHFESLCQHTEPLMKDAAPEDRDCVFLYRVTQRERKGRVIRWDASLVNAVLKMFAKRHDLVDDQGNPLAPSVSRIRVTFGTRLYERTRDLLQTSRALGHSSVDITRQRYVGQTPEARRNFSIVVRAMPGWATSKDKRKAIELSKQLEISLDTARNLLEGGFNNLTSRCSTPFEKEGKRCQGWWSCLDEGGCPSAVVFEDDLYRLYSMYFCVLSLRKRYGEYLWIKLYGNIISVVDNVISPRFDIEAVESAKKMARENPHPAWKNLPECSI